MGILLKLRSILLEYSGNRNIILKQKDEIQELNKEIIKQDRIIFKLKSKNNKLNQENIILKTKNRDSNKEINFNFFDREIEKEILNQLSLAKKEVNIAMAWLTSYELINKLKELKSKGILINLIVDDNQYNKIEYLKRSSTKLKVITVITEEEKKCMHNKYCIIDDKRVIDGSYNWSNNAKKNEEHIIVVESEIVARIYKENFERLINYCSYNRRILIS